jgi:phosphoribosyl-ATP pyrophosphohydrolase/phosphoribosyl-AMP cyclohydrolase
VSAHSAPPSDSIAFDKGLVPAIAQDRLTGQIRMVAWMNAEALQRTLETGLATFYSRSRAALWQKGETSGNGLAVHAVYADCDADTLLLLVDPAGPSCHTGRPTCFFRKVDPGGALRDVEHEATAFLAELENEILARKTASATKSYTRTLLDGGAPLVGAKLTEEAAELSHAIANESEERVANEAADVLYHLLVGLRLRDVPFRRVIEVLARRSGVSGLAEKASRTAAK